MPAHARLTSLDALRGLAALLVVLGHILPRLLSPDSQAAQLVSHIELGQLGVLLFFLISGWLIVGSVERAPDLLHFWKGRALRLYPAYWLSVVVAVALYSRGVYDPAVVRVEPISIAANLTMLPTLLGCGMLISVYWSLQVEMLWYLLASVVRLVRVSWLVVVLLLVPVALLTPALPWNADVARYGLVLACGALLGQIHEGRTKGVRVALIGLLWAVLLWASWGMWEAQFVGRVLALPLFVVWVWAGRAPGWLVWVGKRSYSLYLLHPLLIAFSPLWGAVASFPAAALAYRLVERPALALAKRAILHNERYVLE